MSTKTPVCVTGANAFIGGHVTEAFLKQGTPVRATVRDPKAKKNEWLRQMSDAYPGLLTLFAADLQDVGSFDEAVKGCEVVVHVAAVVTSQYKEDPWKEIINPTVEGVKNVVESCKRAGVRRIVYTSSVGTTTCPEANRKPEHRGKPFEEDQWVTHVTPSYGTYKYSKVLAERALNRHWQGETICILPSWCLGPQQNDQVTSSQIPAKLILNKEKGKMFLPRMYLHTVDVRDVANAHVWAAGKKDLPNGRYNVCGSRNVATEELGKIWNAHDPSLKLPKSMAPWWAMWALSWIDGRITTDLLYEKAVPAPPISNAKIKKAGFTFQYDDESSLAVTLQDCLDSMKKFGVVKAQGNTK